jgi:XTP/dITP diphosphohydrolase
MKQIVVATRNRGKVAEMAAILAVLPVEVLALDQFANTTEAEETADTFAANAILKATHYALETGKACLADDSGLEVDALGGAPGVYSARYAGEGSTDAACNAKLLAALENVPDAERTARFRSVLAYVDPDGSLITVDGTCEGVILREARGDGGFGYDPLFYMPALGKTLAELSVAEKNAVSHRGQAMRNMAGRLSGFFHAHRPD